MSTEDFDTWEKLLRKLIKSCKTGSDQGTYELREPAVPYKGNFGNKNGVLGLENGYFWERFPLNINNIVWSDPILTNLNEKL